MFRITKFTWTARQDQALMGWILFGGLLTFAFLIACDVICGPAHADPQPSSIYAALQAQRNTCQDQAALANATASEELAKVKAELEALKKDFGVK